MLISLDILPDLGNLFGPIYIGSIFLPFFGYLRLFIVNYARECCSIARSCVNEFMIELLDYAGG